jgi:ABC-type phosphate transport system permease subunit
VRRVVRRIELWSVLKLSLVLYTCLWVAVLATLAVIWGLAYSSGQIENLQEFLADVGLENYRVYGDQMFRACAAIGAVGVLAGTVITVLTAALINVISEMTGGIRLVIIEEEPPPRR